MFGRRVRLNYACIGIFSSFAFAVLLLYYWRSSSSVANETYDISDVGKLLTEGSTREKTISLRNLLDVAIRAAQLGGEQVKLVKDLNVKSKGETKEGVNDPVTDADLKSHTVIIKVLKNYFADLEIVSEEHADKVDVKVPQWKDDEIVDEEVAKLQDEEVAIDDVTVWVDPLDATKEFTENLLQYVTTMICVAVRGSPVIGVIHNPFAPETYWGWVDHSVSANIPTTDSRNKTKEKRIIISISHSGDAIDTAKQAFGNDTIFTRAAGAGYKILQVIFGKVDAYLHVTAIKKWDMCAGHALLSAVSGEMTTTKGDTLDYDVLGPEVNEKGLIATLHDHDEYVSALKKGGV